MYMDLLHIPFLNDEWLQQYVKQMLYSLMRSRIHKLDFFRNQVAIQVILEINCGKYSKSRIVF